LSKAEAEYEKSLRTRPFNSSNIIAALNDVRALKAGLEDLELLSKTLF